MDCERKLELRSHSYCLIEVVTKAGLTAVLWGQAFPLYEMMESCKCIPQMRNNWLRYQYKEVILCFILY